MVVLVGLVYVVVLVKLVVFNGWLKFLSVLFWFKVVLLLIMVVVDVVRLFIILLKV